MRTFSVILANLCKSETSKIKGKFIKTKKLLMIIQIRHLYLHKLSQSFATGTPKVNLNEISCHCVNYEYDIKV